ncbi:cholinesterase-like [Hemicordylus capensis]|uniref:cholinesterase-like n=1 Tax=Hemicordylus capensis TaxID=884348 RepID=UPI002304CB23|nr:cholinesterase-like [Hemicordylus capensis]
MPVLLSSFSCLFLLSLSVSTSASEDDAVVVTSSGPIKGKHLTVGSGSVTAFLGIPYAEPPLGKLRFQKPLPHQPWSHVLEATSFGNSCSQKKLIGLPEIEIWTPNNPLAEDCLFLNLWVPYPRPSTPAPILVWIHGGGFITGAASLDIYNGAFLAANENVIVASMNYRLGALGFLYLPPDAPGNVGLWDQWLALKWVKENAAAFGGDPDQLTLLGHSAGAASVGFHLLSSASQPLFARAVLQSGAPNAPWAWKKPEEAKEDALRLSNSMGCANSNHSAIVSCLQGKQLEENTFYVQSHINSLTTDGAFLPDEPWKLLEHIHAKPLLTGITADEGSVFFMFINATEDYGTESWKAILIGMMEDAVKSNGKAVVEAMALKYNNDSNEVARYRRAAAQFFGDYWFVCPMAEFAAKMAGTRSPVYAYTFTHRSNSSTWPEWMGIPHGAEVPYLFGTLARINQSYTEAEAALSRRVMGYWAEFARTGNPTGSAASELQWPLYNATEQNFFHINMDAPQVTQLSPAPLCDFLATHLNATHE